MNPWGTPSSLDVTARKSLYVSYLPLSFCIWWRKSIVSRDLMAQHYFSSALRSALGENFWGENGQIERFWSHQSAFHEWRNQTFNYRILSNWSESFSGSSIFNQKLFLNRIYVAVRIVKTGQLNGFVEFVVVFASNFLKRIESIVSCLFRIFS